MKAWQKNALLFVAGFAMVYAFRSARAAGKKQKLIYNGYEVSEEQKAMLDAQDAAFSASADYATGPFIPYIMTTV